jgi:hypothetical protein
MLSGISRRPGSFWQENYPEAQIHKAGRRNSIVQVGVFALPKFTMEDRVLAACFGPALAEIVVDHCLTKETPG